MKAGAVPAREPKIKPNQVNAGGAAHSENELVDQPDHSASDDDGHDTPVPF